VNKSINQDAQGYGKEEYWPRFSSGRFAVNYATSGSSVSHPALIPSLPAKPLRNAADPCAVLDDAKARMEAIDSYETAQRKLFEAEWARRAEENVQIQSELESLKARYMDRLKRNQDGVAREKATFGSWLTAKQQESQNILEAVELCLKPAVPEPASTPLPAVMAADAVNKPV
jgi:hypothetical protein